MSWYSEQPFHVYLISAGDHQKIGSTSMISTRLRHLQGAHYADLTLELAVEFPGLDQARAVEHFAHWVLRDHHARGEWFKTDIETARRAVATAIEAVERGERATLITRHTAGPLRRSPKNRAKVLVGPATA